MGGAFGRVPEGDTPFPDRGSRFWLNIYGFWNDLAEDDARVAFVRGLSADMEPLATGGQYVNVQGQETSGHRVLDPRHVLGASKYERLVTVRQEYDPENVSHITTTSRRSDAEQIPRTARSASPTPVRRPRSTGLGTTSRPRSPQ